MSEVVLDASAILASILEEPGHEILTEELLASAASSAVNVAEVQAKLVMLGWPSEEAWEDATSMLDRVIPFDEVHARIAGDLISQTRPLGLSLGDRSCLALALALNSPVYTAERIWARLKLQVPIHVIR